ncbi:MAG: response regulator [Thermodesulfobacteriota bacterium]|nr:response regulator [Thermodesulfobacteriota bacterium]
MRNYLEKPAYSVTLLAHGEEVLPHIHKQLPDLILFDLMLPGMHGMEISRKLRKNWRVPIIIVTAKIVEVDRIVGLELGADDYVCKTFSFREIVARVNAVLRRTYVDVHHKQAVVGPIFLNQETFEVKIAGQALKLTPNEFALLGALMTRPNRVFSLSELLDLLHGYTYEGYDRTIDKHFKNLRKKIGKALPGQEVITTVCGIGCKLTVPKVLTPD